MFCRILRHGYDAGSELLQSLWSQPSFTSADRTRLVSGQTNGIPYMPRVGIVAGWSASVFGAPIGLDALMKEVLHL